MGTAALVLVHGANHQAISWRPTIEALRAQKPAGEIIAVDLPGRAGVPTDLATLSVETCVAHIVERIADADVDEVVLVGHSFGGALIPLVAIELGPERVRRLVFIAATIPPEGGTVIDSIGGLAKLTVPIVARRRKLSRYPRRAAARAFCNGMTAEQKAFVLDHLCPDASWLTTEPIHRSGLSRAIPRTWILTTDDNAVPAAKQRRNIEHLGGVDEVIEIDSCHDVMVRDPEALAAVLGSVCADPS